MYHISGSAEQELGGCSSLANRDKRFREKCDNIPGPGAYTIKSKWPGDEKDPCGLMLGKVMNIFCLKEPPTVICERKHEPPSIPMLHNAFGYEEGPQGDLVRQKGPDRDQTIGPAFYVPDPVCMDSGNTLRYRGCFWAKSKNKRSDFGASNKNPGPGAYLDENNDPWVALRRKALERSAINGARVLFVPRYADQVALRNEHDNFPGPGHYDLVKSADDDEADNDSHPPFNASAERFEYRQNEVPGPGAYDCVQDQAKLTCRLKNRMKIAFDASSPRTRKIITGEGCAPGSYNVNDDMTTQVMKRIEQRAKGKMVPFDSSQPRKTVASSSVLKTPGPTDYQPNTTTTDGGKAIKSSFVSKSKRESEVPQNAPPPGTYNVQESFALVHDKKPLHHPNPCERKEGFLVSADRFGKNSAIGSRNADFPGPADYCISRDVDSRTGLMVFQSERFKEKKTDESPGPAHYSLPLSIQDTLQKSTFNETLRPPSVRQPESAPRHQPAAFDLIDTTALNVAAMVAEYILT
ncbi:Sperm-tail PG-rich repeat-containing protein 2 [Sparganum proliferum]